MKTGKLIEALMHYRHVSLEDGDKVKVIILREE